MPHEISAEIRECIANCSEWHNICTETTIHCLGMGGDHASSRHQRVLLDCAQIWPTSADFMVRGSELHGRTCGVCAEACARCAEECERLCGGDLTMLQCAETGWRCAESCQHMAA